MRRGDVAELDVRNPSGRSGEATELDVRRPSGTNPLRFFSRSDARIYMYSFYAPVIFICLSARDLFFTVSAPDRTPKPLNPKP